MAGENLARRPCDSGPINCCRRSEPVNRTRPAIMYPNLSSALPPGQVNEINAYRWAPAGCYGPFRLGPQVPLLSTRGKQPCGGKR